MICDKCGKKFSSKMALCGHLATCGKNKDVSCDICGNPIPYPSMKRHLQWHVDNDKPCKGECGKMAFGKNKFCSKSCSATYNNHGVPRNISQKEYFCVNCGNKIKTRNTRKYCSRKCWHEYCNKIYIAKMESGGKTSQNIVRRVILEIRDHVCEICGNTKWNGVDISLVVDHINGNPYDNRLSNLRLICPNCDSQTPTYMAKNRGNGRWKRRERYKAGKSS